MARTSLLRRVLFSTTALSLLSLSVFAPQLAPAQPRPIPLPGGGGGGGGSGGEGEGEGGKCGQCDREFAEKVVKCMDTFEKCLNACPPCKTRSNCDARMPCAKPCNDKLTECKEKGDKERLECRRGC